MNFGRHYDQWLPMQSGMLCVAFLLISHLILYKTAESEIEVNRLRHVRMHATRMLVVQHRSTASCPRVALTVDKWHMYHSG